MLTIVGGYKVHDLSGAIMNASYYIKDAINETKLAKNNLMLTEFIQILEKQVEESNEVVNDLFDFFHIRKVIDKLLPSFKR